MKFWWVLLLVGSIYPSASTVMMIGDSLFDRSPIAIFLRSWSGEPIDNYAIMGACINRGWIPSIPTQFDTHYQKSMPKTVIMNGGGNDVFLIRKECISMTATCLGMMDDNTKKLTVLWDRMGERGVENIIYLGFYYLPELRGVIDRGSEQIKRYCKESRTTCFFVDPRNETIGLGWDGLHPNAQSFERLAQFIWNTKLNHNILWK